MAVEHFIVNMAMVGLCSLCVGMLVGYTLENSTIGKSVDMARKLLAKAEAWEAYQKALKNL